LKALRLLLVPVALLSLALPPLVSPASAACGWKIVTSDNLGNSGNPNRLLAVAARNATDAWAVGYAYRFGLNKMLVEHWNGTAWTADLAPSVANMNNQLDGVAILSAKNVWAVGYATTPSTTQAVIEHYNGRSWKMVTTHAPSGKNYLNGIVALSASNIWAVGYSDQGGLTINSLLLHYNGSAWSSVGGPNPFSENKLFAVSKVPGTHDLWAVGEGYASGWHTLIVQNTGGTTWSQVASPDQGTPSLPAVAATSSTNAWALGVDESTSPTSTLGEQWDGGAWTIKTTPDPVSGSYSWNGATAKGSTIWIVGGSRSATNVEKTLAVRWTSGGGFVVVASPTPAHRQGAFWAVASIPGTHRYWAVGSQFSNSTVDRTLVERYC
jgi:hypothetical protein